MILAFASSLIIVSLLTYKFYSWSQTPITLHQAKTIQIVKGSNLNKISSQLAANGVITHPILFQMYVRIFKHFPKFQAGSYLFKGSISPVKVIEKISNGDIHEPLVLEYTIPEGFTLEQTIKRLQRYGIDPKNELPKIVRDKNFMKQYNITDAKTLEGYFYPATYRFYNKKPTAKEALNKMIKEFFSRLPKNYEQQVKQKKLTLNEAIIFASLIEKETELDEERPLISEVIWRRLKDGAPLGIDASLIYGIKNYDGDIKWKDLRNKKNLYNSRIHKGLPPTPIGAVSTASLKAVLNPANEKNYYYVRLPDNTKRHHFSRTLKEHNLYVKKLINKDK